MGSDAVKFFKVARNWQPSAHSVMKCATAKS